MAMSKTPRALLTQEKRNLTNARLYNGCQKGKRSAASNTPHRPLVISSLGVTGWAIETRRHPRNLGRLHVLARAVGI